MQEAGDLGKGLPLEAGAEKNETLLRHFLFFAALIVFVFSLGFVSSKLSAGETIEQRDAAQANLRISQLQNRLATAALNARRGAYEPARLAASDFFTDLRAEFDRPQCAFSAGQREGVRPLLNERDEVITLLARNDQSAGERLTDLYLEYVRAVSPSAQKPQ